MTDWVILKPIIKSIESCKFKYIKNFIHWYNSRYWIMEEDEYNDIVTYNVYTRPKLYFLYNIFSCWKVIMCNVIHGYILILNFFHLIWKIYNSIGRNLILKYCPRIIFYNNYITSVFHWNVTIWLVMKWSHDYKRDVSHLNETQIWTCTCLHDDVRCKQSMA